MVWARAGSRPPAEGPLGLLLGVGTAKESITIVRKGGGRTIDHCKRKLPQRRDSEPSARVEASELAHGAQRIHR